MCFLRKIINWIKGTAKNPVTGPIRHIVVLMFENHSFDQMLGSLKSIYPNLEAVDPANPRSNKDSTGRDYFQKAASDNVVDPDPKHELAHILNQIKDGNSGFVSEYETEFPDTTPEQRQRIMDYFALDGLPALHELARHFTICDRWHSSVPGPTWTNRFFVHSGTSKGLVEMPASVSDTKHFLHYDQDTIFDRLNARGISWRVYFGDVPNSLVLRHQWRPENAIHYRLMHEFYTDTQGPEAAFASYVFIEPNYMKGEQNDDHPPHSAMSAQRLLAQVYNAIRKNEALWNTTLLVVLHDEHGGFYDHIAPPEAVPPDLLQDEYTFDRLGVRVPALLISPWVSRGIFSQAMDHTSLLKFLIEKWGLGDLTERVKTATSFAAAIRTSARPATDTPQSIPMPPLSMKAAAGLPDDEIAAPMNENQKALMAFTEYLEQQTVVPGEPATPVGPVQAMVDAAAAPEGLGAPSHAALTRARVLAFLQRQRVAGMTMR